MARIHKKKKKQLIQGGVLLIGLVIVVVAGIFIGYRSYQEKVHSQNAEVTALEEEANTLFSDTEKEDIKQGLTFSEIEVLRQKMKKQQIDKLLSENAARYYKVEEQIDQAESMLELRQKVSGLQEGEVVKDHVKDADIQNMRKAIHAFKEKKIFYHYEEERLNDLSEQIQQRENAVRTVGNLFEQGKVRGDVTLSHEKEAEDAVRKVSSNTVRADLEQSLEQVRKKIKSQHKFVALTFDDGPGAESSLRILNALEKYQAKATFFMLGNNAKRMPETARKIAEAGHEIANHSIDHPNLAHLSKASINQQMARSKEMIEKATGQCPTLFRPPYGNLNAAVKQSAEATGQQLALWSVDTLDWKSRNASSILNEVKKQTRPGAVILMHDIHSSTADALPSVLDYLMDQQYELVTVSELIAIQKADISQPFYGA